MRRSRTRSLLGSVLVIDRSSRASRTGRGVGFAGRRSPRCRAVERCSAGCQVARATLDYRETTDGGHDMTRHRIWLAIAATSIALGWGGAITQATGATTPPEGTPVIDPGDGGDYAPAIDPANFVDVGRQPVPSAGSGHAVGLRGLQRGPGRAHRGRGPRRAARHRGDLRRGGARHRVRRRRDGRGHP